MSDKKTKICSKKDCEFAGQEQDISNFSLRKKNSNKYHAACKLCLSIEGVKYREDHKEEIYIQKAQYREDHKEEIKIKKTDYYKDNKEEIAVKAAQYRQENKETITIGQARYYQENKEELAIKAVQYREDHKEELSIKSAQYREDHKEKIALTKAIYYQDNKEEIINKNYERKKKRLKIDPIFKFRENFSRSFNIFLKSNNIDKERNSTYKILGITPDEIREYLYAQFSHPDNLDNNGKVWMTPYNQGKYEKNKWNENDSSTWKWQVDHIKPQSEFECCSLDDPKLKECWALTNLRPYRADLNLKDGASRIRHTKLPKTKNNKSK